MTPTRRPRHLASLSWFSLCTGVPSTYTSPRVGRSIPVIMLISVDLPLPDLPITATNSPAPICRSTSLTAVNSPAAVRNTLRTWRSSMRFWPLAPPVGVPLLPCSCAIVEPPTRSKLWAFFVILVPSARGTPSTDPAAENGHGGKDTHPHVDPPRDGSPERH